VIAEYFVFLKIRFIADFGDILFKVINSVQKLSLIIKFLSEEFSFNKSKSSVKNDLIEPFS
jgi:hypothetical protein